MPAATWDSRTGPTPQKRSLQDTAAAATSEANTGAARAAVALPVLQSSADCRRASCFLHPIGRPSARRPSSPPAACRACVCRPPDARSLRANADCRRRCSRSRYVAQRGHTHAELVCAPTQRPAVHQRRALVECLHRERGHNRSWAVRHDGVAVEERAPSCSCAHTIQVKTQLHSVHKMLLQHLRALVV
jgi:hypothetical protein